MALNPWEDSDVLTGLKLGDPRSALVLADQHDIQPEKWVTRPTYTNHTHISGE